VLPEIALVAGALLLLMIGAFFPQRSPYFATFLEQLKTAKARTPHPAWPKMEDILTSAGQAILRGEKTPQAALDEAAKKIDAILGAK